MIQDVRENDSRANNLIIAAKLIGGIGNPLGCCICGIIPWVLLFVYMCVSAGYVAESRMSSSDADIENSYIISSVCPSDCNAATFYDALITTKEKMSSWCPGCRCNSEIPEDHYICHGNDASGGWCCKDVEDEMNSFRTTWILQLSFSVVGLVVIFVHSCGMQITLASVSGFLSKKGKSMKKSAFAEIVAVEPPHEQVHAIVGVRVHEQTPLFDPQLI